MTYKYKKYIDENEEIRCGFKVTSNRKKVWNIQLGLLEELKRICNKYNIKYYAEGGTLLGAIRHQGYIPRDDDMDFLMFREDYEKFKKVAENEFPNHIKIKDHYLEKFQIIDINTAAIPKPDILYKKDFMGGIRIDIFPIDYLSKYMFVNKVRSLILRFLYSIAISQTASNAVINKIPTWKRFFIKINRFIFKKINYKKLIHIYDKISKKVYFKGENVSAGWCSNKFYDKNLFNSFRNVSFENTTICIPDGYDKYLEITYGDYMKPVIFEGQHFCYYSVDLSCKDIIELLGESKFNEQSFNNCKYLFRL